MRLALLLTLTLTALAAQPVELRSFSQIAPLDGDWKVTTGDDPRFAATDFDDSAWRTVRLPSEVILLPIGVSWIRFRVQLPEGPLPVDPLVLLLPPLGTSYEVFANGQPVGSFGDPKLTNGWGDLYTPTAAVFALPSPSLGLTIAIRTRRLLPSNAASAVACSAWVGTKAAIAAKLQQVAVEARWHTTGHLMALSATAIAGIFFLLLSLWREDAREFLWCGTSLLALICVRPASVAPWVLEGYAAPIALSWFCGFLAFFVFSWERLFRLLLGVRLSAWGRIFHRGGIVLNGALCLLSPFFAASIGPAFSLCLLFSTAAMIAIYVDLARQSTRVDETPWMHLAVMLQHGGNFIFFLLGFVSVGPYAQSLSLIVRGGGALMFAGVMTVVLSRRSARLQREQQRLAQEMRAGAEMQALLLPAGSIEVPGIQTEAAYLPMSEVGGDFYYALADGDALVIVVGDVSGKGLAAALLVAATIGILRNTAERRPGLLLAALNRALHGQTRGGFVTCCCARFDPDGTVTLSSAGHPAPYADGEEVAVEGLPLGLVTGVDYEEKSFKAQSVTFLSDGVVEAENAQRELFGFDRTRQISTKSAQEIAEAAKAWGQNDDITVVTVQRKKSIE